MTTTSMLHLTVPDTRLPSHTARVSVRRWWVAALVVAGLALGVRAEAASVVVCQMGTFANSCSEDIFTGESFAFFDEARFAFDPDDDGDVDYIMDLFFDVVEGPFAVSVSAEHKTQAEMAPSFAANFPGYMCVPIFQLTHCVEFTVVADEPNNNTWVSEGGRGTTPGNIGYDMVIRWFAATDPPYSNPKMLKHDGTDTTAQYDFDMTIPGSYFVDPEDGPPAPDCDDNCVPPDSCEGPCDILFAFQGSKPPGDPGIGGRDIQFSVNTVAVPEPVSGLLLGAGLGAWLYRRRRTQP